MSAAVRTARRCFVLGFALSLAVALGFGAGAEGALLRGLVGGIGLGGFGMLAGSLNPRPPDADETGREPHRSVTP